MSISVFEAEQMHRWGGFAAVDGNHASDGRLVKLACGWKGGLRDTYVGPAGKADITIHAQDELDGASFIDVYVDDVKVGSVLLNSHTSEWGDDDGGFSEFTLEGIDIAPGQTIDLVACRDGGEFVRIDKVVMVTHPDPTDDANAPCDEKETAVLIHEDWNHARDADDTDAVKRDAGWDVEHGALFTSGRDDGKLKFAPVALEGYTEAALSLRIKTDDVSKFEAGGKWGDTFKIVLVVDGEAIVLDEFVRDGHEFRGSITGQTFGEHFTELNYAMIDLPEGAEVGKLRFISDFTYGNEIMRIDDVKLTASKDACTDCGPGAKVLSFDDLPKGTIVESQIDGVTITAIAAGAHGDDVVIEAEDFTHRDGVSAKWNWNASDHAHIRAGHEGAIETAFTGAGDLYKIAIDIQDEKDGAGTVEVFVNGASVGSFTVEGKEAESGWTKGSDRGRFSTFTLPDAVQIEHGDDVRIEYSDGSGEMGRIDKVTFLDQTTGNRAMVFDTDHPTGGDHDLTNGAGGVLIISEDGDASDPDDNASGGAIRFDFDTPAEIQTLDVVDTEEGGRIEGFDADGNLIGAVEIPRIGDNDVRTVDIGLEGVTQLVVTLDGSGAIDNLCYDHGPGGGNPPKVCEAFEVFADGTATQAGASGALVFDGVTFTADRANDGDADFDDAMIFDSANPTGGDDDLATADQGNVIIISEDGDSSDPDDNGGGGTIRAVFDEVSIVEEIAVLDIEGTGTTIDLFDASGALIRSFDVPPTGDGGQGIVDLENTAGVKTLVLNLNTSGALTEICFSDDPDGSTPLPASLGNRVFLDTNADGIQDAGEVGLDGVTVTLTAGGADGVIGTGDDTTETTVTDADGLYRFDNLNAGEEYRVSFETPAGFVASPADQGGDDTVDSDGTTTGIVTLAEGEFNDTLDQGFYELAGLGDFVFFDADGDGIQDGSEAGIEGVTVTLTGGGADGVIGTGDDTTSTTITDANGGYSFTSLVPGVYSVAFAAPAIYAFTTTDAGSDDALDSDANGITGATGSVTLASGEFNDTLDAGLVDAGTAKLGDRVFLDADGDGVQDTGETGVDGVGVTLLDGDGNFVADTTTDSSGNYLFENLLAGTYSVVFDEVTGFDFTAQDAGGDATDSDADATGATGLVTLAIGEENLTIDAGLVELNDDPTAQDDAGKVCADELLTIDVLANDSDPDGDDLTIVQVDGQAISEGQSITTSAGTVVTLAGGALEVDGEAAYAALGLGEEAVESISYTVSDGEGGEATATLEATFCGFASVETVSALLEGTQVTYTIPNIETVANFADAYALEILTSTNDALPLGTFEAAYCIDGTQDFDAGVEATADVFVATEANAAAVGNIQADNIDSVNWLLNNDFTARNNGDDTGDTYTDLEVQEAIWLLMNGDTFFINSVFTNPEYQDDENGKRDGVELATLENINEIANAALTNGDGFVPMDGDIFGLIIDPTSPTSQDQPFIIGVEYECLC